MPTTGTLLLQVVRVPFQSHIKTFRNFNILLTFSCVSSIVWYGIVLFYILCPVSEMEWYGTNAIESYETKLKYKEQGDTIMLISSQNLIEAGKVSLGS